MVVLVQCFAEAHVEVSEVVGPRHLSCPVSAGLAVCVDEGWTLMLSQQAVELHGEIGKVIIGDIRLIKIEKFLSI